MKTLLALVLLLMIGCASNIYDRGYEVIQGTLIGAPILDRSTRRLTFYVDTADGKMIAIAENKENYEILKSLSNQIGHNKATMYLFCKEADSEWNEYVDSVDYEVYGVGYYDYYAERYVTVITTYGNSFTDVLRSQDWASFTTGLLKKGIGAAL